VLRAVREFHLKHPLLPGIPKQDLRGRELPDSPAFLIDAILAQEKQIVVEGENVRLASHKLVLKQDEQQAPHGHRARFRAGRPGRARAAGCAGEIRRGGGPRPLTVADPAA
jgi:hypothetical protein